MSNVPKLKIPLVKRKKKVINLKTLIASSSEQIDGVPNTIVSHSFFSEVQVDKNPLLYENLRDNLGKWVQNYFIYLLDGYIYFKCNIDLESQPSGLGKRSLFAAQKPETGWKFHISVAPHQIANAWAIIYPIFMENNISVKILDPEILKRKSVEEVSSKQFTIYQFKNNHIAPAVWLDIMQRIEGELEQHGIGKGIIPISNKQITNSEYFSYRNDSDLRGRYISDVAASKYVDLHINEDAQLVPYNLTKAIDPFEEISLHTKSKQNQIK